MTSVFAAQVLVELLELGLRRDALARRQQVDRAVLAPVSQPVQALDPLRDRLPVGQQSAEPALVDVGHARVGRGFLDRIAGLLLGAHEQDRAAARREVACEVLCLLEQLLGLLEVDDVDPAALAEDVAAHLGVPATGLVPEVDACLQQVLDGDFCRHCAPFVLVVSPMAGGRTRSADRAGPAPHPQG
jgi:hypothetical protein